MKHIFISLMFLLYSGLIFSQQEGKHKHVISYTNTNNLEIFTNNESTFSGQKTVYKKGYGFELNSFHGVYVFRTLAFSIGAGIVFSGDKAFKALPVVAQLTWYLNEYRYDGPFILLNTGKNLRIGKFRGGSSAKLGLGYVYEGDNDFRYVIGIFVKGKAYILDKQTNFNYQTLSTGISVGIQFN